MAKSLVILTTLAALLVGHQLLPQLKTSRTFQLYGEIVPRVETDEKVIALTFDDGPEPERVEEVLKMLDDEDVKATFFVVGEQLEQHPRRGKKIVAAGHELGNHSYSHQHMVFVSEDFVQKEVEETDRLIREVGYKGETFFRPPNGEKLLTLPHYLSETGRITVM